jgi:hypothetical protein
MTKRVMSWITFTMRMKIVIHSRRPRFGIVKKYISTDRRKGGLRVTLFFVSGKGMGFSGNASFHCPAILLQGLPCGTPEVAAHISG